MYHNATNGSKRNFVEYCRIGKGLALKCKREIKRFSERQKKFPDTEVLYRWIKWHEVWPRRCVCWNGNSQIQKVKRKKKWLNVKWRGHWSCRIWKWLSTSNHFIKAVVDYHFYKSTFFHTKCNTIYIVTLL